MVETHDLAAEQAVLGACLLSANLIPGVIELLHCEDFYHPQNAIVYRAIITLHGAGNPVDAITIAEALDASGKLRNAGGAPYIHTLISTPPTPDAAITYAGIVAEKSRLRRMGELGVRLASLAESGATGAEVDAVLSEGEALFRSANKPKDKPASFSELVAEWRAWRDSDAADVLPTPWHELNDVLAGGLQKSRLYVLGGRPGMGKTVSALNMASYAAEQGKSVLLFSLEMPKTEVASRLLASGAQTSFPQIVRRQMTRDTFDLVEYYAAEHDGMKLSVVDKADISVEQIVASCRAVKDLDLAVIDYAQLVAPTDRRVSRDQQVAHVSRTLKILAKDMGIAVVLAAQLNRQMIDGKTGKSRYPTVADLRESGSLESDADAVLLLHRPDDKEGEVEIVIGKNRSGITGVISLIFMGHQARIA